MVPVSRNGRSPRGALCALLACAALLLGGCGDAWNDPYPSTERGGNTLYSSFSERPKHLDPAQAYTSDEFDFIWQVYEPPLQYHYLKRPYTLVPGTAREMPQPRYFDARDRELPRSAEVKDIAYTVYEVRIQPGVRFQPHPAFATDEAGRPLYLGLDERALRDKRRIADFPRTGTRDLVAADYVHQIKRLAHPRVHSPILGHMADHIDGLKEFAQRLAAEDKRVRAAGGAQAYLDLEQFDFPGAQVVDAHTYRIRIKGKYPQFLYWLAMPFFAPVPPEADRFYAQPGMAERNLTLDWYPVGTGAYMLTENNPNARMVLERNPNYRGAPYPSEGEPQDAAEGLLRDAGKSGPFIDRVVYTREKEGIPYWNKFLQGYYDQSGISNDNFDNAVRIGMEGDAALSAQMEARGIRLRTSVATTTFYMAFNWLDPVVGSASGGEAADRARKLRQAVSIALDFEEFISIFANGRGIPGQGPVPPGIFGFRDGVEGVNPVVYDMRDGQPKRKPIEAARKLLAEAGYPGGRDSRTGQPLVLYLDTVSRGPGDKARLDWYRKQFQRIDIQLEIRATDWNRFQEKVRKGNTQLYFLGWNADYPDPENFLFLLYGPQSVAKSNGENRSNYVNPEFDRLFERMKNMDNGAERQQLIDRMVTILRQDAPWVWGYHPKDYGLYHAWLSNVKPNQISRNGLKYHRLDPALRQARRAEWNPPRLWPALLALLVLGLGCIPAVRTWRAREARTGRGSVERA